MQPSRYTRLILAAAWTLFFGASGVSAQVVLSDGKVHSISDDSHQLTRIEVREGTTLRIESGAVIAALLGPANEFAIQLFDSSKLVVQDGAFGGAGLLAGSVAAFDDARVIVQDGTFGSASGFRSGMFAMHDRSTLSISGGTFETPDGSGGRIELYDESECKVSGGVHAGQKHLFGSSTLKVSGGSFGVDNPGFPYPLVFRGAIFANESSKVRISGGTFGASGFLFLSGAVWGLGASDVRISGGLFRGAPGTGNGQVRLASPDARARISGGQIQSEVNVAAGVARIELCASSLPFGPLTSTSAVLEGVLASGDVIAAALARADSSGAVIELVEESCE